MKNYHKFPRLYSDKALTIQASITLEAGPAHYLKSVLRCQAGDFFRIFNGRDGEFIAEITALGKKDGQAVVKEKIKSQPARTSSTHLIFSPTKKHRMDFLIEKAVELGATDLHPVITSRCVIRKINTKRLEAQIVEAAEQCERLDVPELHAPKSLEKIIAGWDKKIPMYACLERTPCPPIQEKLAPGNSAFLIGPEGGFDDPEISMLRSSAKITPVSLGDDVLRSETAAVICLTLAKLTQP